MHVIEHRVVHRPRGRLSVRRRLSHAGLTFVGSIEGRDCVVSPTPKGARCALLRRVCTRLASGRDLF